MNGKKLARVLRTDKAYRLLDRVGGCPGIDWTHGGCQILAKSLKMLLPEGEILVVWNIRDDNAEHCVFQYRGRVYDGDGSFDPDKYLERFAEEEAFNAGNLCLQPYEPDYCCDMPDILDTAVADFLAEQLDINT